MQKDVRVYISAGTHRCVYVRYGYIQIYRYTGTKICTRGCPTNSILVQPTDIKFTQYIQSAACAATPDDEQIMIETCGDP
jgi:hypothetical protein